MDFLTNIPNSELKEVFIKKVESESEKYAELYSELQNVCVMISRELRQINELFPEYTPHDKDYHVSHLFRIADILLGSCRYEKMNATELYLLIVSMYAHDWGMAVSKLERYYIATGKKIDENDSINLLDDENERIIEFANLKLGKKELVTDDEMELEYWQDYIRDTHALRSATRIQNYYQNINSSIAAALYKICIGHWLDIEDISDRNGYYVDSPIFGETVNLRALTIYIRLIDLFDLAEDRTPYVIWKYVNPQNVYSKMEWNKHRALHQITCPSYESGRVICISGSTNDHEVYAALLDFKILCEKYFRECLDLLAHMNNSKYELGVYFLDWRIEARNFKAIQVRFDFERCNIFEILSQEIYNCHPYVYVRELLQNSMDAISLRKEILDRKKVGGDNIGIICIEINDITNDDIEIICKDDGIGMDQYVLSNYFAVLGKSYYQSADFKNKRLNMTPISKFGIGILSCFAVASQMEIYTAREPYLGEGREGLRVIINDIQKQFRVEEIYGNNYEVGTKIILKIRKATLIKHLLKNGIEFDDFNITNYIKKVAEFISYPIVINERDNKTIVVQKSYDIKKLNNIISDVDKYQIFATSYEYPVEKRVVIQDIDSFNKVFDTRIFDIENDLKMQGVEGCLTFSILKDYGYNISNQTHGWPASEIIVDRKNEEGYRIRWTDGNNIERITKTNEIGENSRIINIFNRGFLLEHENNRNRRLDFRSDIFPAPIIKINYLKRLDNISVSRFEDKNDTDIINDIWIKISNMISNELESLSKIKYDYDFWKIISSYCLQFRLKISDLRQDFFNHVKFPFINNDGILVYDYIHDMEEILMLPESKMRSITKAVNSEGFVHETDKWDYGKCLISSKGDFHLTKSINANISSCVYNVIKQSYSVKKANIINTIDSDYPDIQYIFCKDNDNYFPEIIYKSLKDYGVCYERDIDKIEKIFNRNIESHTFVEFDQKNGEYFAYGFKNFNTNHPFTKLLIQYEWLLNDVRNNPNVDKKQRGIKNDLFHDIPFFERYYDDENRTVYNLKKINSSIEEVCEWLKLYYQELTPNAFSISEKHFIPNSVKFTDEQNFNRINEIERNYY